jgi:hypothetical protein
MYKLIDFDDFVSAFENEWRRYRFTRKGLQALFDYLEANAYKTKMVKLDVVALCYEYKEYDNIEGYLMDYRTDAERAGFDSTEDYNQAVVVEIKERTELIEIEGTPGFIIRAY